MPLSDMQQTGLVAVSAGLIAFATAVETIPGFVPEPARTVIAVVGWIAGIVGLSLKEALGAKPSQS
jgi:hypothetical protein